MPKRPIVVGKRDDSSVGKRALSGLCKLPDRAHPPACPDGSARSLPHTRSIVCSVETCRKSKSVGASRRTRRRSIFSWKTAGATPSRRNASLMFWRAWNRAPKAAPYETAPTPPSRQAARGGGPHREQSQLLPAQPEALIRFPEVTSGVEFRWVALPDLFGHFAEPPAEDFVFQAQIGDLYQGPTQAGRPLNRGRSFVVGREHRMNFHFVRRRPVSGCRN